MDICSNKHLEIVFDNEECPLCLEIYKFQELKKAFDSLVNDRNDLLELSRLIKEHPEGYDGPCLCQMCCSYGDYMTR